MHIDWTNLGAGYTYTVYGKGQNEDVYQSIPSKTNVKVLNIYPSKGNNLKGWMENANSESANGYGKGLISVDGVDIEAFNSNPTGNLKDSNGNWKYDVIMFGCWDNNNYKDLTANSASFVETFIKDGRGVLFGHDTIDCDQKNTYFNTLGSYVNINYVGGLVGNVSSISISKKGLLTNYPWNIGDVGKTLDVPVSHSWGQEAHGDIWMKYNVSDSTLSNFYLTTWNNCAMIQTGHSNGAATPDEQKLLANTLFYLAQLTYDTSCDDHKGQDLTVPR